MRLFFLNFLSKVNIFSSLRGILFTWIIVGTWILEMYAELLPSINNIPGNNLSTTQPVLREDQNSNPIEPNSAINNFFNEEASNENDEPSNEGATFTLEKINFTGNELFSNEELEQATQDYLQRDIGFTELREIANTISQFYQSRGWWARAIVPPQDIIDGIVLVEIIEAKLGDIVFDDATQAQSISSKLIDQYVRFNLPNQEILNANTLSDNIDRLNDLPGIKASGKLQAGASKGQTDVVLNIEHQPEWQFATQYDNFGSRSSGYMRLSNYLDLLGYLGWGEILSLQQIHTIGSDYWRLAASLPMSPEGHRAVFSYNRLDYELGKPNTNEATGHSAQFQAQWIQQLPTVANTELSWDLALSKADYVNDINTGNSSDKDITKLNLGLNFTHRDYSAKGGVTYGGISLTAGDLNLLGNLSDYNTDQQQARTDGLYQKINFNLNHIQPLSAQWQLQVKTQGQYALKNLDGAERFSLGGAYGIRAYPNSEGSGDDGALLQLEFDYDYNPQSQLKFFYDVGLVSQYKSYWSNWDRSNPGVDKIYTLQGAGLGWNYTIDESSSFSATYAFPIGPNPGADSNGKDNDGTNQAQRLWFTYQKRF